MKSIIRISVLAAFAAFASQCLFIGHPAGMGPNGGLYQNTKIGMSGNDLSIPQTRTGEACSVRAFIFATFGSATVEEAAKNGGVSRIATVDTTQLNVLSLFSRQCTIVKGDDTPAQPGASNNRPTPGFSDTVIMRNGTVYSNVKTIVQGNIINVIRPTGQTITVPKAQVRTIRKGR